ncbi:uncharacterized protein LOC116617666 [Nematostella vectensis]|uniref:uncharacterized protein LOC116617666 n=1 Tax=Nematostella vectensis TaxID=45351 RepID=UPI002076E804|nr:uncharacterized protein LOC116617666 [Nematostella vectensis]
MKAPTLTRGISGKPVSGQVKPALYQFNVSPTGPSVCHSYNPFASAILPVIPDSPYFLDVVGRVFIDSSPNVQLKQCTRYYLLEVEVPYRQGPDCTRWSLFTRRGQNFDTSYLRSQYLINNCSNVELGYCSAQNMGPAMSEIVCMRRHLEKIHCATTLNPAYGI